jgi:hypothetical protein
MSRFHCAAAVVAALVVSIGAPALANDLYPRTTGSGENLKIDYGPAGPGNVVGGGRVVVTGHGEQMRIRHLDPHYAQAQRQGLVPATVGSGEGAAIVSVPVGTDPSRLALIGADGSLPQDSGRRVFGTLFAGLSGRG